MKMREAKKKLFNHIDDCADQRAASRGYRYPRSKLRQQNQKRKERHSRPATPGFRLISGLEKTQSKFTRRPMLDR
jgi:nicotinamidase-related amidase